MGYWHYIEISLGNILVHGIAMPYVRMMNELGILDNISKTAISYWGSGMSRQGWPTSLRVWPN